MLELVPGQLVTLGLATHDHHGELWNKIPQKHVTHEPIDHLQWGLIDFDARVEVNFPSLCSPDHMKATFIGWVEPDTHLGWGGELAQIKINDRNFYIVGFLINCNPNLSLLPVNPTSHIDTNAT